MSTHASQSLSVLLFVSALLVGIFSVSHIALATGGGHTPTRISCPFEAKANRTIVTFNPNFELVALAGEITPSWGPASSVNASLPAGTYAVSLASWDGYVGREDTDPASQRNEKYAVKLQNGSTIIATSNQTSDLQDNVLQASFSGIVNSALIVPGGVNKVVAYHPYYPTDTWDSVFPICVAFDRIEPPPERPTCTLSSDPTSIYEGDPSTLSWTLSNATSFSIDQGVGSVSIVPGSTTNVMPPTTTTYIGIATGPGGTATCTTRITITPPPGECKLTVTKSANKTEAAPNDTVEYTITFKNIGTADCTGDGVKVMDTVDARLSYISETHSLNVNGGYGLDPVYKASDRTLRFNAGTLTPNESGWVKWKAKIGTPIQCSETIPNTAKITSKEYNNFRSWVISDEVNVTVKKDCTPSEKPLCTLTGTPSSINRGDIFTLVWTTTNATGFSIDQGIGSITPVSGGTFLATPINNATFIGTATGPGGTATCETRVTIQETGPACTMAISKSQITPGESVTVSWTSTNSTGAFITHVGTSTPVSAGSTETFPSANTTYTGTFTGPFGTTTCSVDVRVTGGPGGCQGNCGGGGYNQPNVVLYKKATEQPLVASVFLSQIPYTGFEAGLALSAIFWFAVALFAAVVSYFIVGQGGVRFFSTYIAAFAGLSAQAGVSRRQELEELYEEKHESSYGVPYPEVLATDETLNHGYSQSVATPTLPVVVAPAPVMPTPVTAEPTGIPALSDVIESRAHASGVLMSPESVKLAVELSADRLETLRIFGAILNEAVKTIPREDGWIMLTSDRLNELAVKQGASKQNAASVAVAPSASITIEQSASEIGTSAFGTRVDEASAVAFVGAIVSNDRDLAFSIVRSLEHAAVNPTTLMTSTATVLDRLYRVRHGGKNGVDAELIQKSIGVSDEALHNLVEIFTHSLDTVYSNPFTGVKLALAQAFDVVG